MGVSELRELGITPITTPQWVNSSLTPASASTSVFEDVRFALGAEARVAVALLAFQHTTNGMGATGESQIAAVVDDPNFDATTKALLVTASSLVFYDERTFRVVTTGGAIDKTSVWEPATPYITLRDVRLVAHSITNVDEQLIRLQYQYVKLSEKAFQAILGRNLR